MNGFIKKSTALLMAALLLFSVCTVIQAEEEETLSSHIDSVNGTRWADMICVYKDREHTGQNEWGENIVVNSQGVVTEKVPGGDSRGRNLPIPEGGMIVSGTGDVGKELYAKVNIGDNAYFDEYGMRILFSKGEINPFYKKMIPFTDYNSVRWEKTLVVYNQSGKNTETNGYGYEVSVNASGIIIASGGNNSVVPEGGFVVSAIENPDIAFLKAYFIPGARCYISGKLIHVEYTAEMLGATVENEIALAQAEIETAKAQYRLVDCAAAQSELNAIASEAPETLAQRDSLINRIKAVKIGLIEKKTVDIRAVWYEPLERKASDVKETVEKMAELGINQLCLGVSGGHKTFVQMPSGMPFSTDPQRRNIDLFKEYVDACNEHGIELILSVSVFHGNFAYQLHPEWVALPNKETEEPEEFYSPANSEYREYFKSYIKHIITNYDIDGIQWDYIRYPFFDGETDYGYDEASKKLFSEKTGLPESTVDQIGITLRDHAQWETWVSFKTELVNSFVQELSQLVRETRPDLYISACLANDTGADLYCQNGREWTENNWVDAIYPMSYAEGIMGQATEKFASYITDNTYLIMGNGAYLSLTLDEMYLQISQIAANGGNGIGFFEWGAYIDHGYASEFKETLYASNALSFTANEKESVSALLESAKARFEKYVGEAGLFGEFSDLNALKAALLSKYEYNKYLYQDIDLALKIQAVSKEEEKAKWIANGGIDSIKPADSESSHPESTASAPAESQNSPTEEHGISPWLWVGIGLLAALAIAVACFLVFKKKS